MMDGASIINLHNKIVLPISLNEAWEFFATSKRLSVLTPPVYQFKIIGVLEHKMYLNQIIRYQLKMYGWPMIWVSKIVEYEEGVKFSDKMCKGPYKVWHHEHKFSAVDGGVLVEDNIKYDVGFGYLGKIINKVFISKQLNLIFEYRNNVLKEKFG